jgi:Poly(ADP-ribose) polymerase catalytic domain
MILTKLITRLPLHKTPQNINDQLKQIAAGLTPSRDAAFPYLMLKQAAEKFVSKNKTLDPIALEKLILGIIINHPRLEISLAAFIPSLNNHPIQAILREQVGRWNAGELSISELIEVLSVANHWRPDIVPNAEVFYALGFMRLQKEAAEPRQGPLAVKNFFLSAQVPNNLIVSYAVAQLAHDQYTWLSRTLEQHTAKCAWNDAYLLLYGLENLSRVLQMPTVPDQISLRLIVDASFPNWRIWMRWKPNVERIKGMARWRADDQIGLREILQLEGPCFLDETASCQRDMVCDMAVVEKSLHTNIMQIIDNSTDLGMLGLGSTVLCLDSSHKQAVVNILDLLIDLVCRAAQETEPRYSAVITLVQQATSARMVKELEVKALSECVLNSTPVQIISAVTEVLFGGEPASNISTSMLTKLLEVLDDPRYPNLTKAVVPVLNSVISEQLQERLEWVPVPTEPPAFWLESHWENLDRLQKYGISLRWSKIADNQNASLDTQIAGCIRQWPERLEFDQWRVMLRALHANSDNLYAVSILQKYIHHRFVPFEPLDDTDRQTAESLVSIWAVQDAPRRQLSTTIIGLAFTCTTAELSRMDCLNSLSRMQDDLVARLMSIFTEECLGDWTSAYQLITCLASHDDDIIKLWQFVPRWHLELQRDRSILDWAVKSLSLEEWFNFMENIVKVFPEIIAGKAKQQDSLISGSHLLTWSKKIKQYQSLLSSLEREGKRFISATEIFRRGTGDVAGSTSLEMILDILSKHEWGPERVILLEILTFLDNGANSIKLVEDAMLAASQLTQEGIWICDSVLESYQTLSIKVVETMVVYLLCSSSIHNTDKDAIQAIWEVIALDNERDFDAMQLLADPANAATADAYFREEMQALVSEAFRLERLRRTMNAMDRNGTVKLIKELGIEDSAALRTAIESLPVDLVNSVELINDSVFELLIPIDTLKPLARRAMGAGTATSLIIRFSGFLSAMPLTFCIHLNTDIKPTGVKGHSQIDTSFMTGEITTCYGRTTPLVYQLGKRLRNFLSGRNNTDYLSIKTIQKFIVDEISSLGSNCTVCGAVHQINAKIEASTSASTVDKRARRTLGTCQSVSCITNYAKFPLEIRLSCLREDPQTFDFLLQGVAAAVHGGLFDSLPTPPPLDDSQIKRVLIWLPEVSQIREATDLEQFLNATDSKSGVPRGSTADFLSWIAFSYAGLLMHAVDNLHLPSLPGSHQFLLAETDPIREVEFAGHVAKMKTGEQTQIMFHATSMARLPMILEQGLRCMSGTTLQAHGSSYGKGVYLSPEPATAWPYATSQVASHSWTNSTYKSGAYAVLLGCELAGKWSPVTNNKNIYVVTDPSCVVVRFFILMPKKNRMPIAGHIVPAITSVCAGLKSGAL